MPTSIVNIPSSAQIGVAFSPMPSFSGAAASGTIRVQDLTTGYDSGTTSYTGTSGTFGAYLNSPTGNHSIKITFGNGEIFNYIILAYNNLLSSSINTGGTGYSGGTFTLTRNTALTPFKPVNITGGDGTITYTLTGTLPAGLTYSSSTGNLGGTPTASGTASLSVTVTDSSGQSTSQSFNITVYSPLSSSINTGGTGYSGGTFVLASNVTLTPFKPVNITGGDGTITYTLTGVLPVGLNYSSSTGNLSGTPRVGGTVALSVTITDANSQSTSQSFSITVSTPLTITASADSIYGINATVSTTVPASINVEVGGVVQVHQNVSAGSFSLSWTNDTGFAGNFIPGQTYVVTANDTVKNSVSASVTLPSPSLTLVFSTGSYTLSSLNTALGTSYTSVATTWSSNQLTYVLTGATAQTIKSGALANNTLLTSIKDYGSVSTVSNLAFLNCIELTSIVFPFTDSVGDNAFNACTKLTNVNIAAATTIGDTPLVNTTPKRIVMRGSTSTQALFGNISISTSTIVPTYIINTDTWPSLSMAIDLVLNTGSVYTGTVINVVSTGTNLPDGYVFTASVYSSTLDNYYNTTTFRQLVNGTTVNDISIPNGLPIGDSIYITYDPSRRIFPVANISYDAAANLYANSPISNLMVVGPAPKLPDPINYAPITADSPNTVGYGSSANIMSLNVSGTYNTATIVTNPHSGTVLVVSSNIIQYTPNSIFNGLDQFDFKVSGPGLLTSNTSTVYVTVRPPTISISPSNLTFPVTRVGAKFINTFTASSGHAPYTFAVASGNIPPGTAFSSTTGILSGTNTVVGTYNFAIQATDSSYPPVTGVRTGYTILVFSQIPDAHSSSFTISEGSPATIVPLTFDSTPATVSIVSAPTHGTAIASGPNITYQPTPGYSGLDSFTFRGTNLSGTGAQATVSITVSSSTVFLVPTSGSILASGTQKKTYIPVTISATGGYGAYVFSATGLPTGLSINSNGIISGTPTVTGIYYPVVTVHDSGTPNLYTTGSYVIDVLTGPSLISTSSYNLLEQASLGIAQLKTNLYNAATSSAPLVQGGPAGGKILASQWTNLYNDIESCFVHQNGTGSVVTPVVATVGTKVFAITSSTLLTKIGTLITNYKTAAADQLTQVNTPYSFTAATNSALGFTFVWPDTASAQAFFNLGGKFRSPDGTQFDVNNYNPSVYTSVNSSNITVTNGSYQVYIGGKGNKINFILQMTPTGSMTVAGSAQYFISNNLTGGIAARSPSIQNYTDSGASIDPLGTLVVRGNEITTASIAITNGSAYAISVTSITPVHDATISTQLTFAVVSNPLTLAPGVTKNAIISWQNNTQVGALFKNKISVLTSDLVNPTIVVDTPVQTRFGLKLTAQVPSTGVTITKPYLIPYLVEGYGGVLDNNTINLTVPSYSQGFLANQALNFQGFGGGFFGIPLPSFTINPSVGMDVSRVPNVNTSTVATFVASTIDGISVSSTTNISLTLNVQDQNLGTWISAQNANNGVIGMSYDIINGQRCLTIGFGMGGDKAGIPLSVSVAAGRSFDEYSAHAVKQLGLGFVNSQNTFDYVGTPTSFSSFLKDYAIWYPDATQPTIDKTYSFLARNGASYNYTCDSVGTASATFYVDGSVLSSPSGTITLSAGFHTVRIVATSNSLIPGVGLMIYDNTFSAGRNIWSTLDAILPTWCEISRVILANDGTTHTYTPTPNVYNSNFALNNNYSSYFTNGSMFTVIENGSGQLSININSVDHLSGSAFADQTLVNVDYLFYYYSAYEPSVQYNRRYNNIGGDVNTTPYFTGFLPDGTVTTRTVPTPAAATPGSSSDLFSQLVATEIATVVADLAAGILLPTLYNASFDATGFLLYDTYNYIAAVGAGAIGGGATIVAGSEFITGLVTIAAEIASTCFAPDTLIDMADGSRKPIKDIEIGDRVWNWDKTQINCVKHVDRRNTYPGQQLWSPSKDVKPFATIHHPLYLDSKLSIPCPAVTYEVMPWFGKLEQAKHFQLSTVKTERVYNFYTDGDFTFRANGYGTTMMLFESNMVGEMLELGYIKFEDTETYTDIFDAYAFKYPAAIYGGVLFNKVVSKIDWKLLYWMSSVFYKHPKLMKLSIQICHLAGWVGHKLKKPFNKL